MKVWLRHLIVCLMALALPVQGVAGMVMTHCGASHARMQAAIEAAQHPHAGDAGPAAHHHDADAVAVDGESAAVMVDASAVEADASSELAQYKCSSCASCCAGSALPSAMPRLPAAPTAPAVFAEDVITVDAFASDGPDRPPRIPLV